MQIYGVSFDMVGKQPIVLLKTVDDNRFLPIWIGAVEATAIAYEQQGVKPARPLTHDLFVSVLELMGVEVARVEVTDLVEGTYYSMLVLERAGVRFDVDARPSDALALAVRVKAPVFVAEHVLEQSALRDEFGGGAEA